MLHAFAFSVLTKLFFFFFFLLAINTQLSTENVFIKMKSQAGRAEQVLAISSEKSSESL